MDGWMRFDAQRKKLYFCAAGAAFALFLAAACFMGPRTYIITDGERVMTYSTFATDPSLVLSGAGVELDELDSFSADRSDIRICRSSRVLVWYHGQLHILTAGEETVETLLRSSGLELSQDDQLSYTPDTRVWDGMELRIDRIFARQEVYSAAISHETLFCYDPTLPEGIRQVMIPGADGELLRRANVVYTNGLETGREILAETMTRAPVTEIVAVGTGSLPEQKPPELRISDGYIYLPTGEVLTYRDTAKVLATAYTHTDEGCDMITYTGTTVRIGTVAVDPRYIPYGTRMFIVSDDGSYVYGIGVAEDCGGAIKGDRIDLYFPTYDQCIQFGRRDCTIYFLG